MSKYGKEVTILRPSDMAGKIRDLERWENDKQSDGFVMSADLFNMTLEICSADRGDKKSHDPVKVFNWLKSITEWRSQANGGVIIDFGNKFHAERCFDFVGDALMGYFKTRMIASTYGGEFIRYLTEPERKRGEISPKVTEVMRAAGFTR